MRTPEEIAREAAGKLVEIAGYPTPGRPDGGVYVDGVPLTRHAPGTGTDAAADVVRVRAAAAVLAAVEEALRGCPVPSPVSEARLAFIRRCVRSTEDVEIIAGAPLAVALAMREHLRDLLADNEHLRAVVRDCWQDGSAAVWAAGYEAGVAAQKAADVGSVVKLAADYLAVECAAEPAQE